MTRFIAIISAVATMFATTATAEDANTCAGKMLSYQKMVDGAFKEQMLVPCNSEVFVLNQQRGWKGTEWSEAGVRYRLVEPSAGRWTTGVPTFIGPESSQTADLF